MIFIDQIMARSLHRSCKSTPGDITINFQEGSRKSDEKKAIEGSDWSFPTYA